jgi:endoglucanase
MATRNKCVRFGLGVVVVVAAAWILGVVAGANSAVEPARFRRGISISHAMAWASIEPGPARAFAYPPFADEGNALTATELQAIRRTGFDFVRLAVDPGPFLQFQGEHRTALDRILLDRVNLILASGIAVVVDFHPSDLHPDYTAAALTGGAQTPIFQSYLHLLERTAGLLADLHSSDVALELMNEPPVQPEAWQPMLDAAYAAARSSSPDLVLVVEGGDEASMAALLAMHTAALAKDPATLFAFHYYNPYQFTHQGASWNAARYLADVPYPARARPLAESLAATGALISATDLSAAQKSLAYRDAQDRLESYWYSKFDGATIAKDFQQIADWARSRGIPSDRIMLGEFGAKRTALQGDGVRAAERTQWFHDVRAAADAQNFGWAVWTYRGEGGFELTPNMASNDIDPGVAEALGLNFRAQLKAVGGPAEDFGRRP